MFIDCTEHCPFQKDGICFKADCVAENQKFESYNICPYVAMNVRARLQNNLSVSKIPLTGIKSSV